MRFLVFFNLLIYSILCQAEFDESFSQCLDKDWTQENCNYLDKSALPEGYYQNFVTENLDLPGREAIRKLNLFVEKTKRQLGFGTCGPGTSNQIKLDSFTSLLQHAAQTRKLSKCQTACLALCASSTIVRAKEDPKLSYPTPCEAFQERLGNCMHYTSLALYFLEHLNVESRAGFGQGFGMRRSHYFTEIKLDGTWYLAEPRHKRCNFFRK